MNKRLFKVQTALVCIALLLYPSLAMASKINTYEALFSASTRFATPETEPAKAFDNTFVNYWQSNRAANDEWLEVQFADPVTVRSFRLMHGDVVTLNGRLEASNNESDWDVLTTFSHPTTDEWIREDLENDTAYNYYRLYFTTGDPDDAWVKIYEWELYDNLGADAPEFSTIILMGVLVVAGYYVITEVKRRDFQY